jgi:hypothetical protein
MWANGISRMGRCFGMAAIVLSFCWMVSGCGADAEGPGLASASPDPATTPTPMACITRRHMESTCGGGFITTTFSCLDAATTCESSRSEDYLGTCFTTTRRSSTYRDTTCEAWEHDYLLEVQKLRTSPSGRCGVEGSASSCNACIDGCCNDLNDCLGDTRCVAYLNCLTRCAPDDAGCPKACQGANPGGVLTGGYLIGCVAGCACP